MKMQMNKDGFAFSFTWLFSILVGAVVIVIAIFVTTSLIDVSRTESDAKTAAQLGTLLNPIETNLEESKYAVIGFPSETRVFNECRDLGNFGKQIISTSVSSGIGGNEFKEQGVRVSFFNKYLFSNGVEQGSKLYVLVKPFESPYKVADLVFAYTGNYCFVDPPGEIEDEITDVNAELIDLVSDESECSRGSEVVCFGKTGCDVDVNFISKTVVKDGSTLYYEGPLVYGAIFSDPEIYECQVRRLSKRAGELAHVYASKNEFLSERGCSGSAIANELRTFASLTDISGSEEFLTVIVPAADNIRRQNDALVCKMF